MLLGYQAEAIAAAEAEALAAPARMLFLLVERLQPNLAVRSINISAWHIFAFCPLFSLRCVYAHVHVASFISDLVCISIFDSKIVFLLLFFSPIEVFILFFSSSMYVLLLLFSDGR